MRDGCEFRTWRHVRAAQLNSANVTVWCVWVMVVAGTRQLTHSWHEINGDEACSPRAI